MNDLERRELKVVLPLSVVGLSALFYYLDIPWLEMLPLLLAASFVSYGLMFYPLISRGYHKRRIAPTRLEVEEGVVRQLDKNGDTLTAVRLDEPYECKELFREENDAAYRFYQFGPRVEFLSSDPVAEKVVREILGREWPPSKSRHFYGH